MTPNPPPGRDAPASHPVSSRASGTESRLPSPRRPRVIAHRGNSAEAPENTIAAFAAALDAGADAIELDLQLTADRSVVVFHDHDLDRTTDLTGAVGERDARDIFTADAGSWFSAAFAGERVPALGDLTRFAVEHSGIEWLLEFKGPWDARTVAPVLAELRAADLVARCTVQSFDPETVRALASEGPDFRVEALIEGLPIAAELVVPTLRELGALGLNPDAAVLAEHPQVVHRVQAAGFSVTPWTLDDEAEWHLALALEVEGIITNRPRALAVWLDARFAPGASVKSGGQRSACVPVFQRCFLV